MLYEIVYFKENGQIQKGIVVEILDEMILKICTTPKMGVRFVPVTKAYKTKENCNQNHKKEVSAKCTTKKCRSRKRKDLSGKKATGRELLF